MGFISLGWLILEYTILGKDRRWVCDPDMYHLLGNIFGNMIGKARISKKSSAVPGEPNPGALGIKPSQYPTLCFSIYYAFRILGKV